MRFSELAGVEFRSRRRARGRVLDLYSIATDMFNLPRSWPRVTCKTAGWQGNGESEAESPRLFSAVACSLVPRLLASEADLSRTWWGINDTCQRANTERRPIPDHRSTYNCVRQPHFLFASYSCVCEKIHALMPSPISYANVRPSARVT